MAQQQIVQSFKINVVPVDLTTPIFSFRFFIHDNHITLRMVIHAYGSVRLEVVPIDDVLTCQILVNSDLYPEVTDDIPKCEIDSLGVVTVNDVLATINNFGLHLFNCSPAQSDCAYWFMIFTAVLELKNRVPAGSTVRLQQLFVFSPKIQATSPGTFEGDYAQNLAVDIWSRLGHELERLIDKFREESQTLMWIKDNLNNEAALHKRVQLLKQLAARGDVLRTPQDLAALFKKVRDRMASLSCQLINWQTTALILKGIHGEDVEIVGLAQRNATQSKDGHS